MKNAKQRFRNVVTKMKKAGESALCWIAIGLIRAFIVTVTMPYALVLAIGERKPHLFWWTLKDSYRDFESVILEIILFCTIIGIPVAIWIHKDRESKKQERITSWEIKHPGKEA